MVRYPILSIHTHFYCQNGSSSRNFQRNLRIGARQENRQLARTASLCIASGKQSTRFPLGWHVQKGYVVSRSHLVRSRISRVWSGSSVYWFEYENSELSEMLDSWRENIYICFSENRTFPYSTVSVSDTHRVFEVYYYRVKLDFDFFGESQIFDPKYSIF